MAFAVLAKRIARHVPGVLSRDNSCATANEFSSNLSNTLGRETSGSGASKFVSRHSCGIGGKTALAAGALDTYTRSLLKKVLRFL